jgi:hypothetical protein
MREFIRRSKPKRPLTTDAGSPVAPATKRQPLAPKSPNTESPLKAKRKFENEKERQESPLKMASTKPEAKKMRRYGMGLKKRNIIRDKKEDDSDRIDVESPADVLAAVDELDEVTEGNSAASRRSSRIRKQAVTAPLSKSAIPTPIKIGRSTGTTLNSAVRSEQQDQTQRRSRAVATSTAGLPRQESSSSSQKTSKASTSNTSSKMPPKTSEATYYLVPNLRAADPSAREVDLDAHSWVQPIVIEDEDLTFGGKSLSTLYEEERRRHSAASVGGNSSDEETVHREEERRGRERVRRHYYPVHKSHRK